MRFSCAARKGRYQASDLLRMLSILIELEPHFRRSGQQQLLMETLLVRYAEGTRLAAHCEKRLAEAELKVQQLTRQPDGEIALQPFPTGTP